MLTLGRTYVTATGRRLKAFHFVMRGDSPELFVHLLEDIQDEPLPRDHFRPVSEVNNLIAVGGMVEVERGKS